MLHVYLKQAVDVNSGANIHLGDVAKLYKLSGNTQKEAQTVLGKADDALLITPVDIACALKTDELTFYGAEACIATPRQPKPKGLATALKTLLVAVLLFAGGSLTIMNYHTDVHMTETQSVLSQALTGSRDFAPWVNAVYCAGVGVGVLFFSDLFPSKKKKPSVFSLAQFDLKTHKLDYERGRLENPNK